MRAISLKRDDGPTAEQAEAMQAVTAIEAMLACNRTERRRRGIRYSTTDLRTALAEAKAKLDEGDDR